MPADVTMDLRLNSAGSVRSDDPNGMNPPVFTPQSGFVLSGSTAHGGELTIERAAGGFGSGPNIQLFDDFLGGSDGDPQESLPVIGPAYEAALGIKRDRVGMPQGRALAVMEGGSHTVTRFNWPADLEVFLSCMIDFDSETAWDNGKPLWLAYDQNEFTTNDGQDQVLMQILTNVQNYNVIGGAQDTGNPKWSVVDDTQKQYVRFWAKATAPEDGFLRIANGLQANALNRNYPADLSVPSWVSGVTPSKQGWGALNFIGFASTVPVTANVYVGDMYVAAGPGACARVEMSDNPILTSSTKFALCTEISRVDTKVITTCRHGTFSSGDTVHLHVVQGNDTSLYAGTAVLQ